MKLEVMLSVMNLKKEDLDKMNITSKCTVINQCSINNFETYKNFNIYSYDEIGLSNSRNRGLEHISEDIVLLCDDDVVYNKEYEKNIIEEFKKNKNADIIVFNIENRCRKKRKIKSNKRLHIYNCLNYGSCNIAFRRNSLKNIKFNILFGSGAKYAHGEDSLFLVDALKNGMRIYSNVYSIGEVTGHNSTWFNGYNEKYFFDKGALFTAINKNLKYILIFQYLIRHKGVLKNVNFVNAYKLMIEGSNEYLNREAI